MECGGLTPLSDLCLADTNSFAELGSRNSGEMIFRPLQPRKVRAASSRRTPYGFGLSFAYSEGVAFQVSIPSQGRISASYFRIDTGLSRTSFRMSALRS